MAEGGQSQVTEILTLRRKEKRKLLKKQKRKLFRQQNALQEIEEEDAWLNDPEEQARIRLKEQEEAALLEKQRREHEEREKAWLEAAARREAEEEEQNRIIKESRENELREEGEDDDGEYVEDGPAEIIWQGNEIIVRKRKVKITENKINRLTGTEVDDRPTSNPLAPQSEALAAYNHITSSDQLLEVFSQQTPNFGTEQDKAHCPFHFKTGACRFGSRCSRVHFYPDKSCTLLIKNMYNCPGLAWEQDEGLEHTDEEVDRGYEEFYEDVHTEFLKYGEIVNFKVCRNGSSHLRGNVYIHYKFLDSAIFAYNSTNGRYFAGKQISCEYVGVTRWKIAICGEYMKSRSKTCSRGSTCNFLHCFVNPGGEYEWADWDNPPPKYWMRKMASLFGPSDEMHYNMHEEAEHHFTEKFTRDGEAHNWRSYSRGSSYLGRERGESSSNQIHSEIDRKRPSHSSKKSHSRVVNKSHSRVGNLPDDCKQYDRRNYDKHHSRSKSRHRKSDSTEESFAEGSRRKSYSSTRSHNSYEEVELDDVRNSGDHHSTRKEWRGRVLDEELREGCERERSCSSKRSQSRVPSSPEDSRWCDIPDFDVPNSNRKGNRKGRIHCYETNINQCYWNHEEEARDSLDRRDGGYDSDSGQEPSGKNKKYRHRRSSGRPVNSSHYVALCEVHDENGCEICTSGKECSLKKNLYNHYYNNEKSEREEPSSKYKECLDGNAYSERHRQNDMSEDERKEHYLSSRSSRSRKKRYATDEKDEVGITKDEARSMDDVKVLNNCDNNDHESQGRNVNNMFDDHRIDLQSNSEHWTDRKRRRDGSKPTRSEDESYYGELNCRSESSSEKRHRSRTTDLHYLK